MGRAPDREEDRQGQSCEVGVMWCPPGYTSLHDVVEFAVEAEDIFIARYKLISHFLNGSLADLESSEGFSEEIEQLERMVLSDSEIRLVVSGARMFSAWLLAATLRKFRPLVCSPVGITLRPSRQVFEHYSGLDRILWSEAGESLKMRQKLARNAFEEFSSSEPYRDFLYLDVSTGIIRRTESSIDEIGEPNLLNDLIENFEGWSVCFETEGLPTDVVGLIDSVDPELVKYWKGAETFQGGKSGIHQFIYKCLIESYPDGKTESWGAVENAVGYSRRSINRALDALGKQEWRTSGGQQ
ncbi:hypothetical protein Q4543_22645 [Salipiger sp. 1_MG-2023]|uniref:hypothetical protein n=1 Tax=Salipiger sp. 1_MG-2023 TaxID=3062665 RepID=UPI0026E159BF|nr:hypothetical protein [Salipiger sp. 1_MG-2023]MDO6588296.1 hypothetical protein [Salipiger sp. 1_MG-2023]